MAIDGVYISGYFTEEDRSELDVYARELRDKEIPFYVRNLTGTILQAAVDFADFELIAVAYPILQEFMVNGGYDLTKYFILKLWHLVTKRTRNRSPFTVSIEGIPTVNGTENIKFKVSEPLSRKDQEKFIDKTFELASQIENHQYQLLEKSRYYPAVGGHIFVFDSERESFEEVDIEAVLNRKSESATEKPST